MGTDELQAFQFAAGQSGVKAEEAARALGFLNKNVGEAVTGNADAAKTFADLKVALKGSDGSVREMGDLLPEIADSFVAMGSDAERTAAAMKIFGKSGAGLIPFLKGGSKGARELKVEFDRLGGGMNKEFIEAADKAGDEIDKMKLAGEGLKSTIAYAMLPALTSFVHWITDAVAGFREFTSHSYIVQSALGVLAVASVVLGVIWGALNIEIRLVVAAIALMILIVDDVYTAFKGGKSVIGDFIDSIFGIGTTKAVFDELKKWIVEPMEMVRKLMNGVQVAVEAFRTLNNIRQHANHLLGGKAEDDRYEKEKADIEDHRAKRWAQNDRHDELAGQHPDDFVGPPSPKARQPLEMMFGAGAAKPPAYVTAPGASSGAVHNGNVVKSTEIHVTNTGLKDPADAGSATLASVRKAIDESEYQAAYAATAGGGGH